jgi:4-oxalocrotonate tautomerase
MPMVQIIHARGVLNAKQQQALLRGVQDAVVAVEGEALRVGVGVMLEETLESPDSALGCLPFVRVKLIRDALTGAQRADMLARVIEAVVAVEGEARRPNIWAVIESSVLEGEWSIGGNPLTLEALSALRQGRNPWKA